MVAHKCAQHNDELGRIAIASRNISKCQAIIDSVKAKGSLKLPADIKALHAERPGRGSDQGPDPAKPNRRS